MQEIIPRPWRLPTLDLKSLIIFPKAKDILNELFQRRNMLILSLNEILLKVVQFILYFCL